MKNYVLLATAALTLGACNLLGNAATGGPGFSGVVNAQTGAPPAATVYGLAVLQYDKFGATGNALEAAAIMTTIKLNAGEGSYSGNLPSTVDLGAGETLRQYRVVVYDDQNQDAKFNAGEPVLADSANGKNPTGDRYLVYASANVDYPGAGDLKAGWNLITDPNHDTTLGTDGSFGGATDDTVTQTFGGIDVDY